MNFPPAQIDRIDWNKGAGLVPAIVQHATSGSVLMLGYMNREALAATLARERVVFFSRSKQRLWEKGETSGHFLQLVDLRADCDADTLLVIALPAGPVCHTGSASCFGDEPLTAAAPLSFLLELEQVIAQRIADGPRAATPRACTPAACAAWRRRSARKVWRSRSRGPVKPTPPWSGNAPICSTTCWCCCAAAACRWRR